MLRRLLVSYSSSTYRMGLTADQVFDKIGSFSRFQLLILFLFNILGWFWFGWPVLLMLFIAAEPKWRCINRGKAIFNGISVSNSSAVINASGGLNGSVPIFLCPLNKAVRPGEKDYNLRCEIPRDLWEFEDTFTSVVTQFDLVCDRAIYGTIASSLVFGGWIIGLLMVYGIWFGRKKGVIIPMILASFGAIGAVLLTTDDESNTGFLVGKIILSMVWAKFWIMISFDGIYVYSSELFPTVIRNLGMGTSTSAAQCGSFLSPYLVYLQRVHPLLPYGIMSALAFVAGILCILLPETRFMPTLENVNQVLNVAAKEAVKESDILERKD